MPPSCRVYLAAALLTTISAHASAQVAPRIVVIVDTSAEMALDLNDVPTFGDGVADGCVVTAGGDLCGTNCSVGIDTNCDGLANDSRIHIVKETVRNVIADSAGVDWALARLRQNQNRNINCSNINDFECSPSGPFVTSYGNPQCNSGMVIPNVFCPFDWAGLIPAECRPGTGGRSSLSTRRSVDPRVCVNYSGVCGSTGAGGDLLVGFPNMGAFIVRSNGPALESWVDGAETAFLNTRTSGNYCDGALTGDCELRPSGPRPLAGVLNAVHTYVAPVRVDDLCGECRRYAAILITGGGENCGGDSAAAAATLLLEGFLTYVVGVGINSASVRTQLNAIAEAGGTDAGAPAGDRAFFANSRAELSEALSGIVQSSVGPVDCPDPSICQAICGDIDDDGVVRDSDVIAFRAYLADPTGFRLTDSGLRKCSVIGAAGPCDLLDVVVLRRALAIPPLDPGIAQVCKALAAP